jgi:hypothetical protein
MYLGSMTSRSHLLTVRLFFSQKHVVSALLLTGSAGKGLRKAVAIPSISAADEHRPDVFKVDQHARAGQCA